MTQTNPGRPPKKWWRDCVTGVRHSGSADDPEAVCGDLWHHKLSSSQKTAATRKEKRRSNECEGCNPTAALLANPGGDMILPIAIVGGLAVLGFVLFSKKSAASATKGGTAPSGGGTAPQSGTTCAVEAVKMHEWALDHGMVGIWLFSIEVPPSVAGLKKQSPAWASALNGVAHNKIVVVTKSGNFWSYNDKGDAVAAPQLKDSYCAWKPGGAQQLAPQPGGAPKPGGAQQLAPQPGGAPAPCTVQGAKLKEWALDHGMVGIWLPAADAPLNIAALKKIAAFAPLLNGVANNKIVVVTKGENFWSYDAKGDPVAAPQLKDSYGDDANCTWKPG